MSNGRVIWDKLLAAGLTPAGAAGLMGNLQAESGLNPRNLQNVCEEKLGFTDEAYTAAVDCGTYGSFVTDGAGYGLAQWTHPSRKAALLAFAQAQGASIGELDMQIDYLLHELQTLFKPLWDKLRATACVREASDCVLLQFERPASISDPDKRQEVKYRRARLAQEVYDKFAKEAGRMKLLKCLLTANDCYKAGHTIKPKGVMVHSTGANNPMLRRYVQPVASTPGREELLAQLGVNPNGNHWNQPRVWIYTDGSRTVGTRNYSKKLQRVLYEPCVHGFIGKLADGSVAAVQTLPWNHRGWHCGSGRKGSANDTHISFEICEDGLTDPAYFQQAYQTAVELTAMLCKEYGLDPLADGVVICHQEGYRRGVASNHGDVDNWFPRYGKRMDDFRADVAWAMKMKEEDDEMKYYATLKDVPEWYKPAVQKVVDRGALNGTGGGELNVSEDFCRTMTVLDRMGKLD